MLNWKEIKLPIDEKGLNVTVERDVTVEETNLSEDERPLPDFGPLDIPNYQIFLKKSKVKFYKKWKILKTKKEQPVQFTDHNCSLHDFRKWKLIGSGFFGQVYLVSNDRTDEFHAMKAVLKKKIIDMKYVENAKTEKLVLQCTNHPFTTRLNYFFKDNSYLYFVLPFIRGGELNHHLKGFGKFNEVLSMFYLAQVILALEYLHNLDIIYRDLKPENILLDHTGYIKLTDFGLCKHLTRGRTYTVCGTAEYLAPEVILNQGYGKSIDWWAVGIMAFNLTTGFTPFKDNEKDKIIQNILKGIFEIPSFLSANLKDLITNTLQVDLTKRYGNLKNGVLDFKNHIWFRPLHWDAVVCRKSKPPYIPQVDGASDTRNFNDIKYQSLVIAESLEYCKDFADF